MPESFRHQSWKIRVHGPSQILAARRSELPGGHVNDIRRFGQMAQGTRCEKVASDGPDSRRFQRAGDGGIAETRNGDHVARLPAGHDRAPGQPRQARSHFAGRAQNQQVPFHEARAFDVALARARQHVFEFLLGANPVHPRVGQRPSSSSHRLTQSRKSPALL